MSDEIKLNEWRWGVVPELEPEAVVMLGGFYRGRIDADSLTLKTYRDLEHDSYTPSREWACWYAILSTEPPKLPEPELRLPEGWEVGDDRPNCIDSSWWVLAVKQTGHELRGGDKFCIIRPTRRECVEEINRILEGR